MSEAKLATLVMAAETLPYDAGNRAILDLVNEASYLPNPSRIFVLERLIAKLVEQRHVR